MKRRKLKADTLGQGFGIQVSSTAKIKCYGKECPLMPGHTKRVWEMLSEWVNDCPKHQRGARKAIAAELTTYVAGPETTIGELTESSFRILHDEVLCKSKAKGYDSYRRKLRKYHQPFRYGLKLPANVPLNLGKYLDQEKCE